MTTEHTATLNFEDSVQKQCAAKCLYGVLCMYVDIRWPTLFVLPFLSSVSTRRSFCNKTQQCCDHNAERYSPQLSTNQLADGVLTNQLADGVSTNQLADGVLTNQLADSTS